MIVTALFVGIAAFVVMLRLLRAEAVAAGVLESARSAFTVIFDSTVSEDEKEVQVRRAALGMFRSFALILGIGVVSLAVPVAIVWLGARVGLYALDDAVGVASSWWFIAVSTVAAVALWYLVGRTPRRASDTDSGEEVPYGVLDQALHGYAFASPARQIRLARIEDRLFARRIDPERAARPVFVTSLPRAGTTILLEALARQPEFASATYRHMPFTLSPLLWGRLSSAFRKAGGTSERAHGDGIEVGFDSPEAFEEMVWRAFWPDHYRDRGIRLWTAEDRDAEFEAFFRRHLAKVVASEPGARRYLSKNNANIARLPLLPRICPDACIVVPIRSPWAQVASLRRQHLRFLDLHRREPFARQYMEGIGHLEFGEALSPIRFRGAAADPAAAETTAFWLRYWIDAYETVLATAPAGTVFVDHDALSAAPEAHLPALADALGMADGDGLAAEAAGFRASRPVDPPGDVPAEMRVRAADLHDRLRARSLGAPAVQVPA